MNQEEYQKFRLLAHEQEERRIEHHHIEANLQKAGAAPQVIAILLDELKTLNRIRRKKRGIRNVAIGSFLLVFGFLITLALFNSSISMHYAMYGLTTLGIVLLFWGMIDLMGW